MWFGAINRHYLRYTCFNILVHIKDEYYLQVLFLNDDIILDPNILKNKKKQKLNIF